ncbi:B2 bradykinin receptor [Pholidichthys leucotaenia]
MASNASDSLFLALNHTLDPCTNYTKAWLWLSSLQPSYLALISIIGFVGNVLVLCVFCLQRKPCSVADIYLGNLAAADLVMMLCLPFWAVTIAQGYQWDFGESLCKLVNVAISMNYICSVLFLMLVSIDRYLALVKPMRPKRLRRATWAKRICLGVWFLGFLFTLPVLIFRKVKYVDDPGVYACILAYPHPGWEVYQNIAKNLFGFLIPLVVITYCTRHTVAALKKNEKAGEFPRMAVEKKATHLVLAVLVVFLFCWIPHQVMRFLDTLDHVNITPGCLWGHVLDIGIQLSTYLAYSNSAINPFLFAIVGRHFRKRAKEVFGKAVKHWSGDMTSHSVSFTSVSRLIETQHISIEKLEKMLQT